MNACLHDIANILKMTKRINRFHYEEGFQYSPSESEESRSRRLTEAFCSCCFFCCCDESESNKSDVAERKDNISNVEKGLYSSQKNKKNNNVGPSISNVLKIYEKYKNNEQIQDIVPHWCIETSISTLCVNCYNKRVTTLLPCCHKPLCGRCIQTWILNYQNCSRVCCLFCNEAWPRVVEQSEPLAASLLCSEQ